MPPASHHMDTLRPPRADSHSSIVHRYIGRRGGSLQSILSVIIVIIITTICSSMNEIQQNQNEKGEGRERTYDTNTSPPKPDSQLLPGHTCSGGRFLCRRCIWLVPRRRRCRLRRFCSRLCWGGPFFFLFRSFCVSGRLDCVGLCVYPLFCVVF